MHTTDRYTLGNQAVPEKSKSHPKTITYNSSSARTTCKLKVPNQCDSLPTTTGRRTQLATTAGTVLRPQLTTTASSLKEHQTPWTRGGQNLLKEAAPRESIPPPTSSKLRTWRANSRKKWKPSTTTSWPSKTLSGGVLRVSRLLIHRLWLTLVTPHFKLTRSFQKRNSMTSKTPQLKKNFCGIRCQCRRIMTPHRWSAVQLPRGNLTTNSTSSTSTHQTIIWCHFNENPTNVRVTWTQCWPMIPEKTWAHCHKRIKSLKSG